MAPRQPIEPGQVWVWRLPLKNELIVFMRIQKILGDRVHIKDTQHGFITQFSLDYFLFNAKRNTNGLEIAAERLRHA